MVRSYRPLPGKFMGFTCTVLVMSSGWVRLRGSPEASGPGAAPARHAGGVVHDVVQQAVVPGLLGREPAVAVGVLGDLLDALPAVLGDELGHPPLGVEQLLGLDLDVGGGAA